MDLLNEIELPSGHKHVHKSIKIVEIQCFDFSILAEFNSEIVNMVPNTDIFDIYSENQSYEIEVFRHQACDGNSTNGIQIITHGPHFREALLSCSQDEIDFASTQDVVDILNDSFSE